jgi:acyl-CoA thioesterase
MKIEPRAPFERFLGIEIEEKGDRKAVIKMPYQKRLTNPMGTIHGGVIASLADTAMAIAAKSILPPGVNCYTAKFQIKYKSQAKTGMIWAKAKVKENRKRLLYMEATVTNESEEVIAFADATFMVTNQVSVHRKAPENTENS